VAQKLNVETSAQSQPATPSMGKLLSWIVLSCGIGLLFLGVSSAWKGEQGLHVPKPNQLSQITGELKEVSFLEPIKSPSVVDVIIYLKGKGLKRGYFNYGLHIWEERLKPFKHQQITIDVAKNHQIWGVYAAGKTIVHPEEVEKVFLSYKKGQQAFAIQMDYVGGAMIIFWLLFLRRKTAA